MTTAEKFDYSCLGDQAEKLRTLAATIREGTKKITQAAIVTGGAFLSAKEALEHGVFLKWCDVETAYSRRSVELYMNLALLFNRRRESDGEDLLLLSLSAALALGSPSVPEAVVTEILARARRGDRVTVEFVKEFVRGKKASAEPAFDASLQMANIVVAALDKREKSLLLDHLGLKPGAKDKSFMKNLRSVLFEKQHQDEARRRPSHLRALPAA